MANLKNNPAFVKVFESEIHGQAFYVPAETTSYHVSRLLAVRAQDIFSQTGSTRDFLSAWVDHGLKMCEDENSKAKLRTDMTVMFQNLKYRLQYPVDDMCAIRMGAIVCFTEEEDPEQYADVLTQRKLKWALGDSGQRIPPDPDLFAFFLRLGIDNTISYNERSEALATMDYFDHRMKILNSQTPETFLLQSQNK